MQIINCPNCGENLKNLNAMYGQDGKCKVCGVRHNPSKPHALYSKRYRKLFYERYGRHPSWMDALKHCPVDIKEGFIHALKLIGEDPTRAHIIMERK